MRKRGSIVWNETGGIVLMIMVVITVVGVYLVLSGKLISMVDFFKNLRFGR